MTRMQMTYIGAGEQLPVRYAQAVARADMRQLCRLARLKRYLAERMTRSVGKGRGRKPALAIAN